MILSTLKFPVPTMTISMIIGYLFHDFTNVLRQGSIEGDDESQLKFLLREIANAVRNVNLIFWWRLWVKLVTHFWTESWIKRKWNCSCRVTENKKDLSLILTRTIEVQLRVDDVSMLASTIISVVYQLRLRIKASVKRRLKQVLIKCISWLNLRLFDKEEAQAWSKAVLLYFVH